MINKADIGVYVNELLLIIKDMNKSHTGLKVSQKKKARMAQNLKNIEKEVGSLINNLKNW